MKRFCMLLILGTLAVAPAAAQSDKEGALAARQRLLKAIQLPQTAQETRDAGVPAEDVKEVLQVIQTQNLPAAEAQTILAEETKAVRENGPVDNFGAFVQSKLAQGLRGRDLAAAIHAEHAARGKGKGHGRMKEKGAADKKDRDDRGQGMGQKPEKPDRPGQGKKPEDRGQGASGGREKGKPPAEKPSKPKRSNADQN